MHLTPASAFDTVAQTTAFSVETLRFAEVAERPADLSGVDLVIAPLFGDGFDAVDLIDWLGRSSFRGRLRVTTQPLPDLDLVLLELQDLAEPMGITVELYESRARQRRRVLPRP